MPRTDLYTRKKYTSASGDVVKITGVVPGDNCKIYLGDNGRRYFPDGSISTIGIDPCPDNLSAFVKEHSLIEHEG